MTLGEKIKTARLAVGLTQRQLGIECGFSEAAAERMIQHWEHNRREPDLHKIRPLPPR